MCILVRPQAVSAFAALLKVLGSGARREQGSSTVYSGPLSSHTTDYMLPRLHACQHKQILSQLPLITLLSGTTVRRSM